MTRTKRLSFVLAGCLIFSGLAGAASAQPWMDRDYDRGWRDQDRGWDRDRDWDRGPRWRGRDRDRDCYYETRRERNRYGDLITRRYRVCED